jgi:hypothetical protein
LAILSSWSLRSQFSSHMLSFDYCCRYSYYYIVFELRVLICLNFKQFFRTLNPFPPPPPLAVLYLKRLNLTTRERKLLVSAEISVLASADISVSAIFKTFGIGRHFGMNPNQNFGSQMLLND